MNTTIRLTLGIALLALAGCNTTTNRCDESQQLIRKGACCGGIGQPCERGGESGGDRGQGQRGGPTHV